jgi:hypothetical protein
MSAMPVNISTRQSMMVLTSIAGIQIEGRTRVNMILLGISPMT